MGRSAIVLAAGHGSRMKSKRHKVLHEVCGKPMILHILDELEKLHLDQVIVVVGQQREQVSSVIQGRAVIAVQEEQLGTGHAVQCAAPYLAPNVESTVVLYGDAPLITAPTLDRLLSEREHLQAAACVLAADVRNPYGLGRLFTSEEGVIERIVEEKDATPEEKKHTLINTGIYAFRTDDMLMSLRDVQPNNAQREYYLTDTVTILRRQGRPVHAVVAEDADEVASVNDRAQLADVERILRARVIRHWAQQGVTIVDPAQTYIGLDCHIGQDTVLHPGTILEGTTRIGEDCQVGPFARLKDAVLEDRARVEQSVVLQSTVGKGATVGPFAYLRPGSQIGPDVKIGDFVEVKNSTIGQASKVSHLAYVGDAEIGARVNVGCGVITVNYDGEKKHRTVVGDDSFIGSNTNLIAPVTVGEGAYVCAGSTITDEVPDDALAIARARQTTKPNYVKQWKVRKKSGQ